MKCPKCKKESDPYKLGTRSYNDGIFQMRKCTLCAHVFKAEFINLTEKQKNFELPSDDILFNGGVLFKFNELFSNYKRSNHIIVLDDEFQKNSYKRFREICTQILLSDKGTLTIGEVITHAITALKSEMFSNTESPDKKHNRSIIPSSLRHEVFKRDNYRCIECGATNKDTRLHIDHIIPVSTGGTDELSNLQTLCNDCNLSKSDRNWTTFSAQK